MVQRDHCDIQSKVNSGPLGIMLRKSFLITSTHHSKLHKKPDYHHKFITVMEKRKSTLFLFKDFT